jgi:hypothetical protein
MYSAPVTLFGFVDFDATFAEGIRVTGLYGPYQFLLGDQKGKSFAAFASLGGSPTLKMLMENNFKFDWLQAVFIQKNPKRTLQVWHLKEPLVLGTLTSLTIPAYEIVYRSASMLVDNMPSDD